MAFTYADTISVGDLCTLFNTAFSDYVLPIVLTEPVMHLKLTRDGTRLDLSPLAQQQGKPVGFILNALGDWQGKTTAYNGGTGVVPSSRGQALTEQMYRFVLPSLRAEGVEQCLLEVVQENRKAFGVYQKLGFEVARTFSCFRETKANLQWHGHGLQAGISLSPVAAPDWALYQTFWDVAPSWQHHAAAIDRSAAYVQMVEAQVNGQCVGYGICYPMTGAIAQLAVNPAWRGKGVGQALLQHLLSFTTQPAVSVLNVAEEGESLLQFLQHRKMAQTLGQYEMIWTL